MSQNGCWPLHCRKVVPPKAAAVLWDLTHIPSIVSTRLRDWGDTWRLYRMALPAEHFPAWGLLGTRHEAGSVIAHNFVCLLSWLAVQENSPQTVPALSIMDRQFRKTVLFDKFFRLVVPTGIDADILHW